MFVPAEVTRKANLTVFGENFFFVCPKMKLSLGLRIEPHNLVPPLINIRAKRPRRVSPPRQQARLFTPRISTEVHLHACHTVRREARGSDARRMREAGET